MVFLIDDLLIGLAVWQEVSEGRRRQAEAAEAEEMLRALRLGNSTSYGPIITTTIGDTEVDMTVTQFVDHANNVARELAMFKDLVEQSSRRLADAMSIVRMVTTPYEDAVVNYIRPDAQRVDVRQKVDTLLGATMPRTYKISFRCTYDGLEINDDDAGYVPLSTQLEFTPFMDSVRSTSSWSRLCNNVTTNKRYWGLTSFAIASMVAHITSSKIISNILYIDDAWLYTNHAGKTWEFESNLSTGVPMVRIG